jgi:hypothetical protein
MTAARESTDAQWEAYYAARALAVRISAAHNRACAAAARLHPLAHVQAEAAEWEAMAAECDALAAELETGETA